MAIPVPMGLVSLDRFVLLPSHTFSREKIHPLYNRDQTINIHPKLLKTKTQNETEGYLLIITINPNSPPIAIPAADPADIPEEGPAPDCLSPAGVSPDWFLEAEVNTPGVVSVTLLGPGVGAVAVGDVGDVGFCELEVLVVVDDEEETKGPSATIFLKPAATQTLIWLWMAVQTSYCLLQHQAFCGS